MPFKVFRYQTFFFLYPPPTGRRGCFPLFARGRGWPSGTVYFPLVCFVKLFLFYTLGLFFFFYFAPVILGALGRSVRFPLYFPLIRKARGSSPDSRAEFQREGFLKGWCTLLLVKLSFSFCASRHVYVFVESCTLSFALLAPMRSQVRDAETLVFTTGLNP